MTAADDRARILDRARDETPDVLDEVVAETRDLSTEQAAARLAELGGYIRLSGRQRVEQALLGQHVTTAARAMAAVRSGDTSLFDGGHFVQPNSAPGVSPAGRGGGITDRARRVVEARHRDGTLPGYAAERCEGLLNRDLGERTLAARYIEAAGSPEYSSAFDKWARDPGRGHMMWDRAEQDAYKAVHQIRASLGEGVGAGGELLPLVLDPTIMITSAGSNNTVRQAARVVQTASNQWQGVSSAGASAEWKAENAQAADASFTMAAKPIPVYAADVAVPYSYEVGMDALDFQAQLQKVMEDAIVQLTNTGYTTGVGTTQPKGFVPNAIAPARTAGAFTAADVFLLQNSLPARFSGNGSWMSHITVANLIRQFVNASGQWMFPELRNTPPTLLGKLWRENSNMSSDVTTAASRFLVYADFQQYVVADRLGTTLQLLPGYGANQRPTGQNWAFLFFRTGADLLIPTAAQVIAKT